MTQLALVPVALAHGTIGERRAPSWWRPGPTPMGFTVLAPGVVLHDGLREVRRDGQRWALTPTEYALLAHLAWNQGRIVSDDELADAAWGRGASVAPQTLYAHVSSLRRKLGRRVRIRRRYGAGYHLERAEAGGEEGPGGGLR